MSYFNDAPMYADVFNQSGGNSGRWDLLSNDAVAATLDSTGAPTAAAWTGFTADYPSGQYTLSWDGTGSINLSGMGTRTTTTSGGVQHNTVVVTLTQNAGASQWTRVTATPPVSNIHMMVPSSNQVSGSVFTKDFYARMAPFTNLRFMDALVTNDNTVVNWSDRTWPTEGSRVGTAQGMAYEDIIDFANHSGKDVWINVPVRATDDYVCRLARLFLSGDPADKSNSPCSLTAPAPVPTGLVGINSVSKIYLEFSNETWNWGFEQTNDLYCMANGSPKPGGSCALTAPTSAIAKAALADNALPWARSSNLWYNGTQMSVLLTKRTGDIFKTVFGSRSGQVKTVQNVQSGFALEIDPGFQFMKQAYGPLTGYIDYMAVAPYADTDGSKYEDNLADLFSDLNEVIQSTNPNGSSNSVYQWIEADLAEANKYGLPLVAYEGGQGLVGGPTIETTAQTDTRMYAFYQEYMAVWDKLVGRGHLFNAYTSVDGTVWGALTSLEDPGSQKWDALLSLVLTPGDANGDGSVTQADCAIVQANYGKSGMWWSQGDFNHDGVVNAADLAILNQHITGTPCSAP
jgi:hypothetical protein